MRITQFNDEWLMVQAVRTVRETVPVLVQIRKPSTGSRLGAVIKEYEDVQETTREELQGDVAIMTQRQYDTMQHNYTLGGWPITWKGVMRYSSAHYSSAHNTWYGQAGQTARKLAKQGVPCKPEMYSLFLSIGDSV
ncbi:hypothetical protein PP16_gp22 [Pectobacterium phage PP16]|uniref:Uncharacterized protein n=1 Tax=Pectobacterium phage PP16 TaxID=1873958 RepID=A0A1B1PEB8_9CAUD|nr:hypothetical protein PP16_gp22 [Pectobacterium phage PP16]ANT45321.1 hypothetical protein PP16_gp22 [Pectobacterium phage PP16]